MFFFLFVEGGSAFVCNSEIACVQNMLQLANKSGHQSLSKIFSHCMVKGVLVMQTA